MRDYLLQVGIALDQLGNAFFFAGWADESISARAWRLRRKRRWSTVRRVIDAAFRLIGQHDHCQLAYLAERRRLQLPPELRA